MRFLALLLFLGFSIIPGFCGQDFLFTGQVNSDNINIRSDATVTSAVICLANKGDEIGVVKDYFDWYKIRLPEQAVSYINKDLVSLLPIEKNPNAKTAKVEKDNVNIRNAPSQTGTIIGKAGKNEVLAIVSEIGQWYQIKPPANSFGWINKRFVTKNENAIQPAASKPKQTASIIEIQSKQEPIFSSREEVVLIGTINPYGIVLGRKATHKLITQNGQTYLLKGAKKSLDDLNYRMVKVTGIISSGKNNPIIEVKKLEVTE